MLLPAMLPAAGHGHEPELADGGAALPETAREPATDAAPGGLLHRPVAVAQALLERGFGVLMTDTDTVWLQNAWPHLNALVSKQTAALHNEHLLSRLMLFIRCVL